MERKVPSSPWSALISLLAVTMSAASLIRVFMLEKHVLDLEFKCQSSVSENSLLKQRLDQVMYRPDNPLTPVPQDNPFVQPVNHSRFRRDTSGQCLCPAGPPGEPGKRGRRGKKGDAGPPVSALHVNCSFWPLLPNAFTNAFVNTLTCQSLPNVLESILCVSPFFHPSLPI